jgi:predicted ArsR family transcriptional regulator
MINAALLLRKSRSDDPSETLEQTPERHRTPLTDFARLNNIHILTVREKIILRVVVENYINSALPVSSKAVAELSGLGISSATARNAMSSLTSRGYLARPHTSAGVIPDAPAYRFYVNEILAEQGRNAAETAEINRALRERLSQLDAMIKDLTLMIREISEHPVYALLKSRATIADSERLLEAHNYGEVEKARQLLAYLDDGGKVLELPPANKSETEVTNNGQ